MEMKYENMLLNKNIIPRDDWKNFRKGLLTELKRSLWN